MNSLRNHAISDQGKCCEYIKHYGECENGSIECLIILLFFELGLCFGLIVCKNFLKFDKTNKLEEIKTGKPGKTLLEA